LRIGIDIDDTMADTFDYLMPYIAEFFNLDIKYLKNNNISYNTLPEKMKERELEFAKNTMIKLFLAHLLNLKSQSILIKLKT